MSDFSMTTNEVLHLLRELDDEHLPLSTLAAWAQMGLVVPSVSWTRKRGPHPRRYSLADVGRVRLVCALRREGLSMPRVRVVLAVLEPELRELLSRRSNATIRVDGWHVVVERPGHAPRELPSGQLRLPLKDVVLSEREARRFAA
jgi:DNA-binding transcriptional MerR regulator